MEISVHVLILLLFFLFVVAVTKIGTEIYCVIAKKVGLLDQPDKNRKLQNDSIPVGGGVVVFLVTVIFCIGILFLNSDYSFSVFAAQKIILPLFISAALLVCIGLIDDKYGMKAKVKLFFQVLAASIVIVYAKDYSMITFFGLSFDLGHLFYPLGVLWLVGMINAINLLDGADGVASIVGLLISAAIVGLAVANGHPGLLCVAIVFSGAILGFFLCNRPPAKVYLGDTGSMLLGLVLGVLLLRVSVVENRVIYVIPPLAVALIPAMDSIFAVIRRKNSGRGIFTPDRGHIHHRLQTKYGKGYKILGVLTLLIIPGCLAAIIGMEMQNDWIPFAVSILVLIAAASLKLFGHNEFRMISHRLINRLKKQLQKSKYEKIGEIYHFQGVAPWAALWQDFVSSLKAFHCVKAHLDINMPFLHEDYSSEWENLDQKKKSDFRLQCSIPLIYNSQKVGTLNVTFDTRYITNLDAFYIATEMSETCTKYIVDYVEQKVIDRTLSTAMQKQETNIKPTITLSRFDGASRFPKPSSSLSERK